MSSVPFRPLGDRVVIKADVEDRAPEQTESGLVLAKTMAAAVEGSDSEDSWFVGTVVAVGPLVNRFDVRQWVTRYLKGVGKVPVLADRMLAELGRLPADCPDPVQVGDRVTFSWAAGQQITVDGERFLILKQSDILAVLEEAA